MSSRIETHRELKVWQESILLAEMIYQSTVKFPPSERFGMVVQMRRAAVSVPANIAEGAARSSSKEFANFLSISRGSLAELETLIELAARLGFIADRSSVMERCSLCGRMLSALIATIRRRVRNRAVAQR